MRDYQIKANVGGVPDSITTTKLGAGEANSVLTENENAVKRAGLTLAPADGTGEDTTQLAQSLFIHAVKAQQFQDGGSANTYELTPISGSSGVLLPGDYGALDGARISFVPGNTNTGASTANIGQTGGGLLGSKAIFDGSGSALSGGEIVSGVRASMTYDASADGGSGAFILDETNASGRLRRVTTITASGTYNKPSWLKFAIVEGGGGGGGGGGAEDGGGLAVASGGGAGAPLKFLVMADDLASSETVTVGAAGEGGAPGDNDGTAGGTSSFGSHATATGGSPGQGASNGSGSAAETGGDGGSASYAGTVQRLGSAGVRMGEPGSPGIRVNGVLAMIGQGASSPYGSGGRTVASSTGSNTGAPAVGFCAGGAGGRSTTTAVAGGDGAPGFFIVYEYE